MNEWEYDEEFHIIIIILFMLWEGRGRHIGYLLMDVVVPIQLLLHLPPQLITFAHSTAIGKGVGRYIMETAHGLNRNTANDDGQSPNHFPIHFIHRFLP